MKRGFAILALAASGSAVAQVHDHGGGFGGFGTGGMPMQRGSQSMEGMERERGATHFAQPGEALAEGEVRKIDFGAG